MGANRVPFEGRSRAVWVVPSLKLLPPPPQKKLSLYALDVTTSYTRVFSDGADDEDSDTTRPSPYSSARVGVLQAAENSSRMG
jgi:hypothetical protein